MATVTDEDWRLPDGDWINRHREHMATKLNPGQFDAYEKALDDEPMFTLLARDKNAPILVRIWAEGRKGLILMGLAPKSDMRMVVEALECAHAMEKWRNANDGKWREAPLLEKLKTQHTEMFQRSEKL